MDRTDAKNSVRWRGKQGRPVPGGDEGPGRREDSASSACKLISFDGERGREKEKEGGRERERGGREKESAPEKK